MLHGVATAVKDVHCSLLLKLQLVGQLQDIHLDKKVEECLDISKCSTAIKKPQVVHRLVVPLQDVQSGDKDSVCGAHLQHCFCTLHNVQCAMCKLAVYKTEDH